MLVIAVYMKRALFEIFIYDRAECIQIRCHVTLLDSS